MTQVTLTNLVAKLSPELKRALEASAGAAMNQGVAAIGAARTLVAHAIESARRALKNAD